eukprot:TRINITY_DN66045_c0_g1_i1.p1 TRINITY_DN66045_c0_g1~~TRINITY_DN66045_c0_g1_i1.p1  ORF type:complete len:439 (-),score=34.11 TRINITY_DN66045_c0_g1_i1:270-1586(-)
MAHGPFEHAQAWEGCQDMAWMAMTPAQRVYRCTAASFQGCAVSAMPSKSARCSDMVAAQDREDAGWNDAVFDGSADPGQACVSGSARQVACSSKAPFVRDRGEIAWTNTWEAECEYSERNVLSWPHAGQSAWTERLDARGKHGERASGSYVTPYQQYNDAAWIGRSATQGARPSHAALYACRYEDASWMGGEPTARHMHRRHASPFPGAETWKWSSQASDGVSRSRAGTPEVWESLAWMRRPTQQSAHQTHARPLRSCGDTPWMGGSKAHSAYHSSAVREVAIGLGTFSAQHAYASASNASRLVSAGAEFASEASMALQSSGLDKDEQEEEVKEDVIERLAAADDIELWLLLCNVKQQLMACPGKTESAVVLGRNLPCHLRDWLKSGELRICRILRCYPKDFLVYKEGMTFYITCLHETHRTMFNFERPAVAGHLVRL